MGTSHGGARDYYDMEDDIPSSQRERVDPEAAALDLVVAAHLPSWIGRLPRPRRQDLH
jgi:hypothetical protein